MATKRSNLHNGDRLSTEQKQQLRRLKERISDPDEENPELSDEQLAELRMVHESRQEERRRQNVTLRLTPRAIRQAKALGRGYTGILSRIVEDTLDNPESLKKYL